MIPMCTQTPMKSYIILKITKKLFPFPKQGFHSSSDKSEKESFRIRKIKKFKEKSRIEGIYI